MKPSFDEKTDSEVYILVNFGYWPCTLVRFKSGNEERGWTNGEHTISGGILITASWRQEKVPGGETY